MKLAILLIYLMCFPALASMPKVYLTSLDWPPYAGKSIDDDGISTAVAKEAFLIMGYDLVIEYNPWSRAVVTALKSDKYAGYFPEYYTESDDFVISDPIGASPLGFAQSADKNIQWSELSDIKNYKIGVVQGYVNTDEIDTMIAEGALDIEANTSDSMNLHMIAKGRLDLAIIDKNVFEYLVSRDANLQRMEARLSFNTRLLTSKNLYVAFKNTSEGLIWKEIFNQGLKRMNNKGMKQ